MTRPFSPLLLIAALAGAAPVGAAPVRAVPTELLYVRARAAGLAGDAPAANQDFTTLLAREPGSRLIAQRALIQALEAGEPALAVRAARLLDLQHALRPDGRLLLVTEAIRTRNWKDARAQVDRLQQERLFAFLAPMLRGWIAFGAHDGDPLAPLEEARALPLAQPYLTEQRALLLIAMGRVEEGVTALRTPGDGIGRRPIRIRLIAADALAGTRQKDRALALLEGTDSALVAARARIAAGKRLPAPVTGPAGGVATLLVRVASDFAHQKLVPVGLTLGRYATFLAPQDASGWALTGDLLASMRRPAPALAALGHVAPDDPLAPAARALRVAVLARSGDKQAALAEALADVERPEADAEAWSRVGDVYLSLDRPKDAAPAYAKAIAAAEAAQVAPERIWPLWLQQGSALDLAGDWPGARAALARALALAPEEPLVLNQLGYSQIAHREDVDHASGLIERASSLRPDDPAITDSLGWVRYLRGNVTAAVPLLEKAAANDPAEPTINEHLGDAYWSAGRRYEARFAWRAALVTAEDKDHARLAAKIDFGLSEATASP